MAAKECESTRGCEISGILLTRRCYSVKTIYYAFTNNVTVLFVLASIRELNLDQLTLELAEKQRLKTRVLHTQKNNNIAIWAP